MYLAELRGKLSQNIERMEDVLTSNVFSFFKYSNREVFLRRFLNELGFDVSPGDVNEAQFVFWPRFDDNTEPDLIIVVGRYYLLVEAKYFSGFAGETAKTKAQLLREIEAGELDARNQNKEFWLLTVTADHYIKEYNFRDVPQNARNRFKWINWQKVSAFLYKILESDINIRGEEIAFARDLYDLLDKKSLRDFQGIDPLIVIDSNLNIHDVIFFDPRSARFRGDFIGFEQSLTVEKKISTIGTTIFRDGRKRKFEFENKKGKLTPFEKQIFIKEG